MQYSVHIANKKKGRVGKVVLIFTILILVGASFGAGMYFAQTNKVVEELAEKEAEYVGKVLGRYSEPEVDTLNNDVDFELFWDLWDILEQQYVEPDAVEGKKMFYGAMKGLVRALDDPYTVFMEPTVAKEFKESLNTDTKFEGIGAELGMKSEILTVVAPLDGMPAQIAGLKSGDKILAIDGDSTIGITIYEAVKKIRGPKNTDVTLTIARNGLDTTKDIIITRNTITVKSLRTNLREDNIFVIKLTNFNGTTKRFMDEAVQEVLEANPIGIILDLRNNPGGYLDTAVQISSEWVEDGVIVSEEFNNDKKNNRLAIGRAKLANYKTVVLINEGSASASEIVAGALQDYDKATILGKKSFGKGSVQALDELQDGSSVKITVAKWMTPKGFNINKEGIKPDEEVEITEEDGKAGEDTQMEAAAYFILNGTLDGSGYRATTTADITTTTTTTVEVDDIIESD